MKGGLMNITMEELEEAKNLLLDTYNTLGSIPISDFSNNEDKYKVLVVFNDIEDYLEKMGVDLAH
jgi:hypothetical protein